MRGCGVHRREIFRRAAKRKLQEGARQGSTTVDGQAPSSSPEDSSPPSGAGPPASAPAPSSASSAAAASSSHERALFRFSTDGWRLASFFPIPAFSLEIVQRRPPTPPPPTATPPPDEDAQPTEVSESRARTLTVLG